MGAHYLLTMLANAEPRGLPGTTIDKVEFQRGCDGFPLDDVVVHAHENATGSAATLQIQVKRSILFSPGDAVFRKVVEQIAKAIAEPGFWTGRNELAIATAIASRKIYGPYQDVLRWARQLGSAGTFFAHLSRKGTASNDMRIFVQTLRDHLRVAGAVPDDEAVWKVLGRLQILIFDYTAVDSAAAELARERAVRVLPPEDAASASSLWSVLTDLSEEIAADGGDRDRMRLLSDLTSKSIRVNGDRPLTDVRAAIAEASSQALADMVNRVGATVLARTERVEAVNEAAGQGRYLEIRGDAGVGKSGILRHFAELFSTEGRVVVLSPGRTQPRGWPTMRAVLGFTGTARELLSDLASDGGAALFIDNLDSFNEGERKTVNDLLRASSQLPGVIVIATRRNLGVDELSWLDAEAIKQLRPSSPMVIGELSEDEVTELAEAEPRLRGLLNERHPARKVVRNLYRLSRIASHSASAPTPTTELDMADQWWRSADGERDAGHRERARLLRALANAALGGAFLLDVKNEPPGSIDALIRSETLRDLGDDKVTFHHDVLRQWAIGNLLATDESAFDRLPLDRPASAILARGVELAARFALAREPDGNPWAAMLDRMSKEGTHGSWRRATLLALVHSETTATLLDRESARLLDNNAALLRELIRTVMAVDAQPASHILEQLGVSPPQIPEGLFVPTGASWAHLLAWLLALGAKIPAQALGDVADFYTNWMLGTFGHGSVTSNLVAWLHAWLVELEAGGASGAPPRTYSGRFGYREDQGLIEKLRTSFLMFANKRPDLAADYVNRVRSYKHDRGAVSSIMKFRGTLAQAAPKELAALTAEALIPEQNKDAPSRRRAQEEPFKLLDYEFIPAAPGQGPFLDLLTHARAEGVGLVQRLVHHAIQFRTKGRDPGDDGFRIPFDEGERFFPWSRSYLWSRGESNDYAVASGLMALEAWAHQRLEGGDDFDAILKEVLGPPGTPAAFLLVAIDLIISHWPKSQDAALPFLACPELVSLDRTRHGRDQFEVPDTLGLKAFEREPAGSATRDNLKQRRSRRVQLEQLVGHYGAFGPEALRAKLEGMLKTASQRLAAPDATSNFADPRFMVRHELNLVDPANWSEREGQRRDGSVVQFREYVPPLPEADHLEALSASAAAELASTEIQATLLRAIDNPSQSSLEIAARGAAWAQEELSLLAKDSGEKDDARADFLVGEAIRAAALITVRDGDDALCHAHAAWAEQIFLDALTAGEDVAHRMRSGLKFNPVATAFAGIAELYRREPTTARLRTLLEVASSEFPAGAHGFQAAVAGLAEVDERIPKAVIRCAFAACVKPIRQWDASEEEAARRAAAYTEKAAKAVEDELAWFGGSAAEPAWPNFESDGLQSRAVRQRGVRIDGSLQPSEPDRATPPLGGYIDEQAAALWIGALSSIADVSAHPWLRGFARAYADFSAHLNGLGLEPDEEASRSPSEWNANYYTLLARTLVGLNLLEIDELAVARITRLPDQSFLDITPTFLRAVDVIYFNDLLLEAEAPVIRERFISRLTMCSGWQRLVGSNSSSIESHLGPAVGAIFFNEYSLWRTASYMTPKAMERVAPFLPNLIDLLARGPSHFVALVAMNFVEVSPNASLIPFLVAGGKAWITSYGDSTSFWVELGIGSRFCAWVEKVRAASPEALAADKTGRLAIVAILAALVRLGVAEARVLEDELATP